MSKKKYIIFVCLILVVTLLASTVNSSFAKYTDVFSGESFELHIKNSIYDVTLKSDPYYYAGIQNNSAEKIAEYQQSYNWGTPPREAFPTEWPVETDTIFGGWWLNGFEGDYDYLRPSSGTFIDHSPTGAMTYTVNPVEYLTASEMVSYGTRGCGAKDRQPDNKRFWEIKITSEDTKDVYQFFDFDESYGINPAEKRYFVLVFKPFGNYTTDAAKPSITARLSSYDKDDAYHWAVPGTGDSKTIARNNDIQVLVFHFGAEYNVNEFTVRIDFFDDAATITDSTNQSYGVYLDSGINIYACGFSGNETEANEMAKAFKERFNYLDNTLHLLDE